MSEDFHTRVALEETIRAKSEALFKLRSSITSKRRARAGCRDCRLTS